MCFAASVLYKISFLVNNCTFTHILKKYYKKPHGLFLFWKVKYLWRDLFELQIYQTTTENNKSRQNTNNNKSNSFITYGISKVI